METRGDFHTDPSLEYRSERSTNGVPLPESSQAPSVEAAHPNSPGAAGPPLTAEEAERADARISARAEAEKTDKRIACVECRQQKSKCDAHEQVPSPCTRCQKRRLPCTIKPGYKRTYKRARIAQMEKEFLDLRKTLVEAGAGELLRTINATPLPNGISGASGPSGLNGPNGITGPNGPNGPNGITGPNGPNGPNGITGPNGPNGPHMPFVPQMPQMPFMPHAPHAPQMPQMPHAPQMPQMPHAPHAPHAPENSPGGWRASPGLMPPHPGFQPGPIPPPSGFQPGPPPSGPPPSGFAQPTVLPAAPAGGAFTIPEVELVEGLLECETQTIGEVTLLPEQIARLYREYVRNYHPILPVVDVFKGPARMVRLCPALFWTVMLTGLRRDAAAESPGLLTKLVPVLKSILAEITISPVTRYNPSEMDAPILNDSSVYSVQAFLLWTFWPPLTSSLSADTSWTTVGTAVFNAIRLGIHHPTGNAGNLYDSVVSGKSTPLLLAGENLRTWITCNIVSQIVATAFGFPAFVSFDTSVLHSRRPLPASLTQMMEIAHMEDQVAKTLNSERTETLGILDPAERLPLLQVLGRQFDELESRLDGGAWGAKGAPLDAYRKFQLLAGRVHLLCYYFVDTARISPFELERGLVRAYNAALALIQHCAHAQARTRRFVRYLPAVYILTIWQAACVIAKLAHSPLNAALDLGTGKETFQMAVRLALAASILKHDLAYRSSGIMRSMWQMFAQMNSRGLTHTGLSINGKMSASIFFDCLLLLRQQVGAIKAHARAHDDGHSSSDDDAPHDPAAAARRLSPSALDHGTHHSDARKIILTAPLDPQPMSVLARSDSPAVASLGNSPAGTDQGNTPRVVGQGNTPRVVGQGNTPRVVGLGNTPRVVGLGNTPHVVSPGNTPHVVSPGNSPRVALRPAHSLSPMAHPSPLGLHEPVLPHLLPRGPPPGAGSGTTVLAESSDHRTPPGPTASGAVSVSPAGMLDGAWDLDTWDGDLLWKDVETVMNDFGFNADEMEFS